MPTGLGSRPTFHVLILEVPDIFHLQDSGGWSFS
jgi:hypothetical protein